MGHFLIFHLYAQCIPNAERMGLNCNCFIYHSSFSLLWSVLLNFPIVACNQNQPIMMPTETVIVKYVYKIVDLNWCTHTCSKKINANLAWCFQTIHTWSDTDLCSYTLAIAKSFFFFVFVSLSTNYTYTIRSWATKFGTDLHLKSIKVLIYITYFDSILLLSNHLAHTFSNYASTCIKQVLKPP